MRIERWIYLLPLGVLSFLVLLFYLGLGFDPRQAPSPLVGKAAPGFSLPMLKNAAETFDQNMFAGGTSLLNVWATWCVSCAQEHAMLMEIAAGREVPIYGLLYKDEPGKAMQWLRTRGNPYRANAVDLDGTAAIEWGVYGTPETFVIDGAGVIRHKHTGPIRRRDWETVLRPLVRSLQHDPPR